MLKSQKRGIRRSLGFYAWMRRLQNDWHTHGVRLGAVGIYRHMKESGTCTIPQGERKGRFYCDCFTFGDSGNYRFKDHPTGQMSNSAYRKRDDWYDRPEWQARVMEVERSSFGSDKKYKKKEVGYRLIRICCHKCGYLMKAVTLRNEYSVIADYKARYFGNRYYVVCERCKK